VSVSVDFFGVNHRTLGFLIVVPPLLATIVPDGRRTSSWCTEVWSP
jgi:hypothetical protein